MAAQPVRGVGALQDGRELRVPHSGLLSVGSEGKGTEIGIRKGDAEGSEGRLKNHIGRLKRQKTDNPHLVVQTDPGPMPILMMSAPASTSSSTISPVTTLPAKYQTMRFVSEG